MPRSRIGRPRSGMVLVVVLVCLAVAMTMVAGWVSVAAAQARQSRAIEDRLQATWLAESAVGRAAARLRADPDYQGETWEVAGEEFGGHSKAGLAAGGVAVISIESDAENSRRRKVVVRADYPATGTRANRVSKQIVVDLPDREGGTP
jgi:type II secretory pathway component PulK